MIRKLTGFLNNIFVRNIYWGGVAVIDKVLWSMLLCLMCSASHGSELQPFTSDGCSAFPDGSFQYNELWLACCYAHDYAYWKGGTYSERMDADLDLRTCVAKVGEEEVALIMLAGVRVGGSPFFPTTFRWGYGWSYPRMYGELTVEEIQTIKDVNDADKTEKNRLP